MFKVVFLLALISSEVDACSSGNEKQVDAQTRERVAEMWLKDHELAGRVKCPVVNEYICDVVPTDPLRKPFTLMCTTDRGCLLHNNESH